MNRYLSVLGLILLTIYPNASAWGQGAHGERQFYNQLNSVRNQVRPHFKQARSAMADLRRQGVNTSGWERQLNYVESQLNNMRWQGGGSGGRSGTGFQTINPFGDYLFHGVPIRSKDGKLVTRHLDPDGLAARAEEWARELRDFNKDLSGRQGAERQKYLSDINDKLTELAAITHERLQLASLGGGQPLQTQTQELKPQTLGEELAVAGLPKLEGDTPMLLRDPFGRDDPMLAPGAPIFEPRELTQPSIDRIEVPSPPVQVTALDACAGGAACVAGVVASEGWNWLKDQYWDARVWANDPMHREWLGDAVTIATLPLMFGGSTEARPFIRIVGELQKAAAEAGEAGRIGQLTRAQYQALAQVYERYGIKFGISGGHAETEIGLLRRADPLLQDFLPKWRRGPVSQLRDIDLWFERGESQITLKNQVMKEVKKILGGKEVDLKYSKYYPTESELKEKAGGLIFDSTRRDGLAPWQAPIWRPEADPLDPAWRKWLN